MGLLAVIGPSKNDQRCRDRSLRRRYLPTIPCACHHARTSRSSAGKSIFEDTGLNVGMNTLHENENRPPHLGRTGSSAVPPSVRAAHPGTHAAAQRSNPFLTVERSGAAYFSDS